MVAHTVLLDFTVSSSMIADIEKRSNLKSTIANVLAEHFTGLKPLTESNIDGSLLVLYTGPRGSLITVRGYTEGLVTLNIEYYKQDDEEALLTFEVGCSKLIENLPSNRKYPFLCFFLFFVCNNQKQTPTSSLTCSPKVS